MHEANTINSLKINPAVHQEYSDEVTQNASVNYQGQQEEYEQEKINILKEKVAESKIRNEILTKYSDSLTEETTSRQRYSKNIFKITAIYIALSLLLVVFNHSYTNINTFAGTFRIGWSISNNVLMALVGSTSINVVGMATIVLRFMFTNHHHKILDGNKNG